tara:strand:- start:255 stop:1484 length:1230 start_codon:yes stop_codon:yes gene_type:complete
MILIPIAIITIIIIVRLYKGMFAAFLVFVATKSIIDMFWNVNFGSFSIMAFQGIIIPLIFLPVFKKKNILPKSWIKSASIYSIALSFGLIWGLIEIPLATFETLILNINIYLGFFLIPIFIQNEQHLKKFLIAMMICGIFPILISFYQWQTGVFFQERSTVGLSRYVGLYHDAFPVRFYGLMTLFTILLYQFIFKFRGLLFKVFAFFLVTGSFLSVYLVFSKAAVAILGLWLVLLLLFSKSKIKQGFSIFIGLSVIFLVFGDAVSSNIEQLFSKEIGYQSGQLTDARRTLAGRGYIWDDYWHFWVNEQSVFFQLFGDGIVRPAHNEYLRVLMANGIVGLLFLVIFIMVQVKLMFKIQKKVRVFGMMLLGMYLIDTIGLVPGVYYYYNILVWGIFGVLLMKPQLFTNIKT